MIHQLQGGSQQEKNANNKLAMASLWQGSWPALIQVEHQGQKVKSIISVATSSSQHKLKLHFNGLPKIGKHTSTHKHTCIFYKLHGCTAPVVAPEESQITYSCYAGIPRMYSAS
eukprot:1160563-Pelagomonas_calceolata.AAC.19